MVDEALLLRSAFMLPQPARGTSAAPSTAAATAVYWSRCANALASLSKGFQPFKAVPLVGGETPTAPNRAAEASTAVELQNSWMHTLALFADAVLVRLWGFLPGWTIVCLAEEL